MAQAKGARKFFVISSVVVFLFLLGVLVFEFFRVAPRDIYFSNVSSSSVTVSWNTVGKSRASALVSENSWLPLSLFGLGGERFFDSRDVKMANVRAVEGMEVGEEFDVSMDAFDVDITIEDRGTYFTHHVEITGLEPNTEYSFLVGDNVLFRRVKDVDGNSSVMTLAVPDSVVVPNPVYGSVRDANGVEEISFEDLGVVSDGVVYFRYVDEFSGEKSSLFSSTLNEDGNWYVDVSGTDFLDRLSSEVTNIYVEMVVDAGELGVWSKRVDNFLEVRPIEPIVLNFPGDINDDVPGSVQMVRSSNVLEDTFVQGVSANSSCVAIGYCSCGMSVDGAWKNCNTCMSEETFNKRGCTSWQEPASAISSYKTTVQKTEDGSVEEVLKCSGSGTPGDFTYMSGCRKCGTDGKWVLLPDVSKDQCPAKYGNVVLSTSEEARNFLTTEEEEMERVSEKETAQPVKAGDPCGEDGIWTKRAESQGGTRIMDGVDYSGSSSDLFCKVMVKDTRVNLYDIGPSVGKDCVKDGQNGKYMVATSANDSPLYSLSKPVLYCKVNPTVVEKVVPLKEVPDLFAAYTRLTPTVFENSTDGEEYLGANGVCIVKSVGPLGAKVCVPVASPFLYTSECFLDLAEGSYVGLLKFVKYTLNTDTGTYFEEWECSSEKTTKNTVEIFLHDTEVKADIIPPSQRLREAIERGVGDGDGDKTVGEEREYTNPSDLALAGEGTYLLIGDQRCRVEVNSSTGVKFCKLYEGGGPCFIPDDGRGFSGELITGDYCDLGGGEKIKLYEEQTNSATRGVSDTSPSVKGTTTTSYVVDSNTGMFKEVESGIYEFTYEGDRYAFSVLGNTRDILVYIDKNGNSRYDQGIDINVSEYAATIDIVPVVRTYTYNIREGFNFVSFPFVMETENGHPTAAGLLKYINETFGQVIFSISKYDGQWKMVGQNTQTYDNNDFQIIPGQGYVIKASDTGMITLLGKPIKHETTDDNAPVTLFEGWNLVGIYGNKTKTYTAKSMILDINAQEFLSDNVSKWETDKQMYEGFQYTNGVEYGFDYPINQLNSYFVRVLQGRGNWRPQLGN